MVSPSKDGVPFNAIMLTEYLTALKDTFGNVDSQPWKEILADSPHPMCEECAKIITYLV